MIKRSTFEMLSDFTFLLIQRDPQTHFMCIYDKAGYNMTQYPQTTIPTLMKE